ncbi:MAG: hemolysin III family protein [Ilumatobacteraceae bacterium]
MKPDVLTAQRPAWRGRLHSWVFFACIPAGLLLIMAASGTAATIAAVIYVASLLVAFGTSASYHRLATSLRARRVMQRLDHAAIYILISGTYVPVCLVALPPRWGVPLLIAVGIGAGTGIALKLFAFGRLPWLGYVMYPGLGWLAIIASPALIQHMTPLQLGLVAGGGLAYTIGIPVLAVRRPDPWPTIFGYHEVWHSFTVVAAGLHFAAVTAVVV